jgi:hypothetical protein
MQQPSSKSSTTGALPRVTTALIGVTSSQARHGINLKPCLRRSSPCQVTSPEANLFPSINSASRLANVQIKQGRSKRFRGIHFIVIVAIFGVSKSTPNNFFILPHFQILDKKTRPPFCWETYETSGFSSFQGRS